MLRHRGLFGNDSGPGKPFEVSHSRKTFEVEKNPWKEHEKAETGNNTKTDNSPTFLEFFLLHFSLLSSSLNSETTLVINTKFKYYSV